MSTPPFAVAPNSLMVWKSRTKAASRALRVVVVVTVLPYERLVAVLMNGGGGGRAAGRPGAARAGLRKEDSP